MELVRQFLDSNGVYDCAKFQWQPLLGLSLLATCDPSSAAHSQIPNRLLRHFFVLMLPEPSIQEQQSIFKNILTLYLGRSQHPLEHHITEHVSILAGAAVEMCSGMKDTFPMTPSKIHYSFNQRDVARLIFGLLQAPHTYFSNRESLLRLFVHEAMRVFYDRLNCESDRVMFWRLMADTIRAQFRSENVTPGSLQENVPFFADFCGKEVTEDGRRVYSDLGNNKMHMNVLRHYADELSIQMHRHGSLVVFDQAAEHVLRITRILRQPDSHALLIGPDGVGKRTAARLSCYIAGFECIILDSGQVSTLEPFRQQLLSVYAKAGLRSQNVALVVNYAASCRAVIEDLTCLASTADIYGLFDRDTLELFFGDMRTHTPKCLNMKRPELYELLIKRIKDRVHIILYVNSTQEGLLGSLVRGHPSLVNRCTIDWFDSWPRNALLDVARSRLEHAPFALNDDRRHSLCLTMAKLSVAVHESVIDASRKFLPLERQRFYSTPLIYFEMLDMLGILHERKRKEFLASKERLQSGLRMLSTTRDAVAVMQAELSILEPELQRRAEATAALLKQQHEEEQEISERQKLITAEEAALQDETRKIEALSLQAQNELQATEPALQEAFAALDALDKGDIAEIRVYAKPPAMVMRVMGAVCVLLRKPDDWTTAKQMLADPGFLRSLLSYQKNTVPPQVLEKLKSYVSDPRFNPDDVGKISLACKSMCMWVLAIDNYARVCQVIAPIREKCDFLQAKQDLAVKSLQDKQLDLARVQVQLERIQEEHAESVRAQGELNERIDQARQRMKRASVMISMLRSEEQRWLSEVVTLERQLSSLISSSFLSACGVVYFGVFPLEGRQYLMSRWMRLCEENRLQVDTEFSLFEHLASRTLLERWRTAGLPEDLYSTENAIIATTARKCPLMIDPQGQANAWIRKLENMTWLIVTSPSDNNMLRNLQSAVRGGRPVLLEDVGSTLDPVLEPVLLRQVRMIAGQQVLFVGDTKVEYDRNFRMYITTRLGNPNYSPEVCGNVTLINFSVSVAGLEEQLLSDVVQRERPRLERKRVALSTSITTDRTDLRELEDKILRLLGETEGTALLDNQELIDALYDAKQTARGIQKRMRLAHETEVALNDARHQYLPIARRGAALCFAVADCARIDSSAQTSLATCKELFLTVVDSLADKDERITDPVHLQAHLLHVQSSVTKAVFQRVARGLQSSNRILFAFIIACVVLRHRKTDETQVLKLKSDIPLNSAKGKKPGVMATNVGNSIGDAKPEMEERLSTPRVDRISSGQDKKMMTEEIGKEESLGADEQFKNKIDENSSDDDQGHFKSDSSSEDGAQDRKPRDKLPIGLSNESGAGNSNSSEPNAGLAFSVGDKREDMDNLNITTSNSNNMTITSMNLTSVSFASKISGLSGDSGDESDDEDGQSKQRRRMLAVDIPESMTLEDHLAYMNGHALPLDLQYTVERITEEEWAYFIADPDAAMSASSSSSYTASSSFNGSSVGTSYSDAYQFPSRLHGSLDSLTKLEITGRQLDIQFPVFLGLSSDIRENSQR